MIEDVSVAPPFSFEGRFARRIHDVVTEAAKAEAKIEAESARRAK